MSFWSKSQYTYYTFADLKDEEVKELILNLSRKDLIEWLSWNDKNGIYEDEQSIKELGNIMTKGEGIEIMLRQIADSRQY